jgi:hypothetical protein
VWYRFSFEMPGDWPHRNGATQLGWVTVGSAPQLPKFGTEPDQIVFRVRERVEPDGSVSARRAGSADPPSPGTPLSWRVSFGQPTVHIGAGNVKRPEMREGAMNHIRNWASTAVVAGLILLAPIIAFVVVVMAEMLGDLVARAGAPAIWPAVAGAMAWVLLRKFAGQAQTSRLGSEGA